MFTEPVQEMKMEENVKHTFLSSCGVAQLLMGTIIVEVFILVVTKGREFGT